MEYRPLLRSEEGSAGEPGQNQRELLKLPVIGCLGESH